LLILLPGAIPADESNICGHRCPSLSTYRPSFLSIGSLGDVYSHQATNSVSTNYNALLFERVANFFNRLHIYTGRIPSSPTMSDIVVKIMAKVLAMLAHATKRINQGQLSGNCPETIFG
jgi:hypothetical protein